MAGRVVSKFFNDPLGVLVYYVFERLRTRDGRRVLSTNLYRRVSKFINTWRYRRYRPLRESFLKHYCERSDEVCESDFMTDGWEMVSPDALPVVTDLVSVAKKIYDWEGEDVSIDVMPYPIAPPCDLLRSDAIFKFVTSDEIVSRAVKYLGEFPVLTNISLVRSDPRPDRPWEASQNLHLDIIDSKVFRVIVHISDVDESNGPFSFYPLSVSDRLKSDKSINYGASLVDAGIPDEKLPPYTDGLLQVITGPAGSTLFVDSSNCFHLGSRAKDQSRCVFMLTYTSLAIENMRSAMGLDDLSSCVEIKTDLEGFLLDRQHTPLVSR